MQVAPIPPYIIGNFHHNLFLISSGRMLLLCTWPAPGIKVDNIVDFLVKDFFDKVSFNWPIDILLKRNKKYKKRYRNRY